MFDWPEQIQTSPTSTFFNVIVFLPETVSVVRTADRQGIEI